MSKKGTNEKVFAFIIWTPFHLYNAVRFLITNEMIGKCDAYYVAQSEAMKDYYENAKRNNVFRNTFYVDESKLPKLNSKLDAVVNLFFPRQFIKRVFGQNSIDNQYEKLFISVPTRINEAIISANDCREVVGYDDGTGSYLNNLYSHNLGKRYEFAKRLFKRNTYEVKEVLVNNPEFVLNKDDDIRYERLITKNIKEEDKRLIEEIFGYETKSKLSKYIYLVQPPDDICDIKEFEKIEKEVVDRCGDSLKNELLIRMHPRYNINTNYADFQIDDGRELWEIICDESITEENVLISRFSTAQFTPKLLFNKEPFVIFTFNLYEDYSKDRIDSYIFLAKALKDIYTKKERIIIPLTMDSFMSTIEEMKGNV